MKLLLNLGNWSFSMALKNMLCWFVHEVSDSSHPPRTVLETYIYIYIIPVATERMKTNNVAELARHKNDNTDVSKFLLL